MSISSEPIFIIIKQINNDQINSFQEIVQKSVLKIQSPWK